VPLPLVHFPGDVANFKDRMTKPLEVAGDETEAQYSPATF